jgi:chromosome segregation ATPase
MATKQSLKEHIAELKQNLIEAQKKIQNFDPNPADFEELFNEALDEQGDIKIGNLTYSPSHVLKQVDPTAYRCGLIDYTDSVFTDNPSAYPEYKELEDEIADLESKISDLESELEEMGK